uniref:sulfurtransferase TusA family protein n=1 Tax=Porphyromonas loveana TaxID=1884669 RepID=UPI00359F2F4B
MKVIDTRGKLCPLPLILLKKAVDGAPVGEEIAVMTDNETAKGNLRDYIRELGATATEQEEDGYT